MSRIDQIARGLDLGIRYEMQRAGLPEEAFTLMVSEGDDGAVIVDLSCVLPKERADRLAALVAKYEALAAADATH